MNALQLYQLNHNGKPIKKFLVSDRSDVNKECRSIEKDYKLQLHSVNPVHLYNTDFHGRKITTTTEGKA